MTRAGASTRPRTATSARTSAPLSLEETRYLDLGQAARIHEGILAREGATGAPVRDEGALESAILRPRQAAHYDQADLISQAVLLAIAVSQAQAFADGNKRAALAAMLVFLGLNRLHCRSEPMALAHRLEAVAAPDPAARRNAEAELEAWVRQHTSARPQRRGGPSS